MTCAIKALKLVALVAAVASGPMPEECAAEPVAPSFVIVLDGDTIGFADSRPHARLTPFNAPETERARCSAEHQLGVKAKARLKAIVAAGNLDLRYIRCSCKLGTEHTVKCNYARDCAVLTSNGRNVGDILIKEGLAVSFVCGQTSCPPTPRPWCK